MLFLSALLLAGALYFGLAPRAANVEAKVRRLESRISNEAVHGLWESFIFVDANRIRRTLFICLGLGGALSLTLSSWIPIAFASAVVGFVPKLVIRSVRQRRQERFSRQLGPALTQLASILRAGHTFERALESLSRTQPNPMAQELELVLKEMRMGKSQREALEHLHERFPERDLEITLHAVDLSHRIGSNLAEALERVAEMIRTRAALRDKLLGLTAQGRAQAWIAVAMPAALCAFLNVYSPGYFQPLLVHSGGRILIIACVVSLILGNLWIRSIARMELLK